ncbi:MAG TPA: hypothetical protein VGZ93_08680 [Candidatus Methylacidiphilales bacterium]|jgi:hypothetical protein|nr:hypothetical protein [Candidatus Methylacidiphilales bacterium]
MKKPTYPMEIKTGSSRVKIYRVVEPHRERFTLSMSPGMRDERERLRRRESDGYSSVHVTGQPFGPHRPAWRVLPGLCCAGRLLG